MPTLEITVVCERVGKEDFRALFFDRDAGEFFGGSGRTALEAVAWALDEWHGRGRLGLGVVIARNSGDRPGDRFSRGSGLARSSQAHACGRPDVGSIPTAPLKETSFDARIERSAEPRLFGTMPPKKPAATTRRAAARKRSKKS